MNLKLKSPHSRSAVWFMCQEFINVLTPITITTTKNIMTHHPHLYYPRPSHNQQSILQTHPRYSDTNPPLFIKRALRWAGRPFLQKKIFYRFLIAKAIRTFCQKIGEKNPVISGIGPFDNQKFGVNAL